MTTTGSPSATVYLMVSGAVSAYRAPEFVEALEKRFERIITVPTPNAMRVISPRDLVRVPKNNVVESYFDERILPRPLRGPVLFAPCSFNSLNKLAHGVADNLALSITHEMIGFGEHVTVALSLNAPLFAHPIVRQSITTLAAWGVTVVEPKEDGQGLMLAATADIVSAMTARL